MTKRIIATITSVILILSVPMTVNATKISDIKAERDKTQQELEQANSTLSNLKEEREGIEEEINTLDEELMEVMASISMVEDEIVELEGQIEETEEDLKEAIADEEAQYEAMKKRIQYMYEKGDYSYLELLLECKNMSDLVSKSEYVEELYEYDRKMLIKYQEARQLVEDTKEKLLMEQEELEVSKHELDEEKAGLDELLEEKKAEASDYDAEIAKVKQAATLFKAKIKQQNAQIKKLEEEEAKKAAEEAAKASAGKSNSSNVDSSSIISGASGSAKGKDIANFACRYVGNPYVAGGTSLTNGADCSGFTFAIYKEFGISLPRTSTAQRGAGREVSLSDAQPGDIVCYAGHVAIYIGGGRIVHASTPSTGIKYGNVNYKPVITVRRIVD
ncbi:MAG: C40 family peptidase [Lachnospiraceae bacterium]|nr:C40 family peptidase [Lachnospiraceae bacterium]MCI7558195.1 NlpC/P60 family protein [Lachnospiraceae bacterium]MDD7548579.1 NlpC/P60 family protein [Lachnospiraceae bacterium]